jgi:hypothetical protein
MNIMEYEWKRCTPWIEEALEYSLGSFTIDDIKERVWDGRMQFWPGKKCALVSEIHQFPRKKWLHVPFIGGEDLSEVKAMQPTLWSFAKFCGCDGLTGGGRPGWVRALRDLGWRQSCIGVVWTP